MRHLKSGVALIFLFFFVLNCSQTKRPQLSVNTISESLCVSSHILTENDNSSYTIREQELKLLNEAGVGFLRRDFLWHEIEPEKGNFDFSGYERIVNEVGIYGMEFIGLLAYGNTWASEKSRECVISGMSGCTNYPPDNPEDFASFVFHTVNHFKDNVHLWEIWNEPNLGINFFKPLSDPEKYAQILKAGYESAKSADPEAIVSFGGVLIPDYTIEPSGIEFLNEVFNALPDANNYFDVFSFHPYMYPYPPSLPPEQDSPPSQGSITTVIETVRSEMNKLKVDNKLLWITEVGWPVLESLSEDTQAAYLIRSLLLSLANGVQKYCWYTTWDADGSLFPEAENYFGLIHNFNPGNDSSPKPKKAYHALKTLSQIAGGYHVRQGLTIAKDNIYSIELIEKATGNKILVLWEMEPTNDIVEIERESGNLKILNMVGEEVTQEMNLQKIMVNPDIYPLYIIFMK